MESLRQSEVEMPSARILIALKCPVTLAGFEYILRTGTDGIEICGLARSPETVREGCLRHRPEMLMIDTWVDRTADFSLIRDLLRIQPGLRTVVMHRKISRGSLQQAIRAGALAHVTEEDSIENVLDAVLDARVGRTHLGSKAASVLVESIATGEAEIISRVSSLLTPREIEVFRVRAAKQTIKDVAHALNLSIKTVEGHLAKIRKKLHIDPHADLRDAALSFMTRERFLV